MKVLDLFSGIGGFSLGLDRAGMETVAFCEIDKRCREVLERHWPDIPCYDDIKTLTMERLRNDGIKTIDVICGGSPCQDISIANSVWGKREGLNGERSGLWREYKRLIKELGPSFVIFENVSSMLGKGLVTVLQDLCEIGYDAEWHCIPAAAVGSLQNRDRIWVIAYPRGEREQGLFEGRGLGEARQGRACGQKDLPRIYATPLEGNGWPQPLICGGARQFPGWVDRIKQLGNSVDPAIPELIGRTILHD